MLRFLLALSFIPLFACHSMRGQGQSISELRSNLEDIEITPVGDAPRPSTAGPLSLVVLPPLEITHSYGNRARHHFAAWADEEQEILMSWARGATAAGLVSEVRFLPSLLVPKNRDTMIAARQAGRTAGADAVLVTRLGTSYEVGGSALSLLDLAIVPAFLIPSATFRATAIVEGAILDVETGYAYATGASQASYSKDAPSLVGNPLVYQRRARLAGVEQMTARMAEPHGVEAAPIEYNVKAASAR